MAEIAAIEPNGFVAASTFSGCGGSSLGYRMAGFRVVYANEFVEAARDVYRANAAPYTYLDGRDIRTVTAASLLEKAGVDVGALDLLDGSPPCSAFSTAGKRHAGWGKAKSYSDDKTQVVDDLFFEFSRLVAGVQPKVFVAENVSGLVKGSAKGYFLEILAALKSAGYRVAAKLLDASWLGVPQARQRLIFVGVRNDVGRDPAFPIPLPYYYTIADALPWVTKVAVRGFQKTVTKNATTDVSATISALDNRKSYSQFDVQRTAAPTVMANGIGGSSTSQYWVQSIEPESDMTRHATGREWERLKVGGQSAKYFQLVRPDPNAPSPTVTAAGGNAGLASVAHPTECRQFSIAELRRICAFPDDFALSGTYLQQWERLGRAVPPVMMRAIATTIRDEILVPARKAAL